MSNKYGLILPDKKPSKPTFKATSNVFGDDSESEEEGSKKPMLLRPSHNVQRQAKLTQEKAVKEDPTVYQYDEIYDSMVTKKEETNKPKEERKPKYIENLLKTAQKRKIENERRIERQVQKEREKEGDEFADKEVFVTSAYKKKLEELRLEEEKEKREEYLESIGDVTKQSDLGGFYRHIYEQRMGSEKIKTETKSEGTPQEATVDETTDNINSKQVKNKASSSEKSDKEKSEAKTSRNYRKRKSSTDRDPALSEGEIEETDGEHEINRVNLQDIREAKKMKKETEENIDADSDFSVGESDEEDTAKDVKITEKEDSKDNVEESGDQPTAKSEEKEQKKEDSKEKKKEEKPEPKPKIDIWKKRTVGVVFEEALKRYYERKAARG